MTLLPITHRSTNALGFPPTEPGEVAHDTSALPAPFPRMHPSLSLWTRIQTIATLAARLTRATGRAASALLERLPSFLKALSGDVEFHLSVRRGYLTGPCANCRTDVHDIGEMCPRQLTGLCDVCGPVLLDEYGKCPEPRSTQRTHLIVRRWETTPREWRRSHLTILKPDPVSCRREEQAGFSEPAKGT